MDQKFQIVNQNMPKIASKNAKQIETGSWLSGFN